MSRENITFCLEALASMDPKDITSDKFDVHFEGESGDTSVEISIVGLAKQMLSYLNSTH